MGSIYLRFMQVVQMNMDEPRWATEAIHPMAIETIWHLYWEPPLDPSLYTVCGRKLVFLLICRNNPHEYKCQSCKCDNATSLLCASLHSHSLAGKWERILTGGWSRRWHSQRGRNHCTVLLPLQHKTALMHHNNTALEHWDTLTQHCGAAMLARWSALLGRPCKNMAETWTSPQIGPYAWLLAFLELV